MIDFSSSRGAPKFHGYDDYGYVSADDVVADAAADVKSMVQQLSATPDQASQNPALPNQIDPFIENVAVWVGVPACILGFFKTSGITSLGLGALGASLWYLHTRGVLAPSRPMKTLQKLTLTQQLQQAYQMGGGQQPAPASGG